MSEDIRRVRCCFDIRVVFKSGLSPLSILKRVKDELPPDMHSCIAYHIPVAVVKSTRR